MTTPRHQFRYKNTKAEMVYLGEQLAKNTGHLFRKSLRPIKRWPETEPVTWGFIPSHFKRTNFILRTGGEDSLPRKFFSVEDMIFYLKSMLAISQMQTQEVTRWFELIDRKMGLNTPQFPLGDSRLAIGPTHDLSQEDYPELTE